MDGLVIPKGSLVKGGSKTKLRVLINQYVGTVLSKSTFQLLLYRYRLCLGVVTCDEPTKEQKMALKMLSLGHVEAGSPMRASERINPRVNRWRKDDVDKPTLRNKVGVSVNGGTPKTPQNDHF